MRKQLFLVSVCLVIGQSLAIAIPAQITYQGTLKENGTPAKGSKKMRFAITDVTGTHQYGDAIDTLTTVTQGLFNVQLNFTGVDWEHITPYIQVTIENTVLGPPEAVTATVYATIASSVVDKSITPAKLSDATAASLLPVGMIAMFENSCPSGWTVYGPLKGNFPIGADGVKFSTGSAGGNLTHSHTVNLSPHTHAISNGTLTVAIGIRNIDFDNYLAMQPSNGIGSFSQSTANQWYGYNSGMSHPAPVGTNPKDVSVNGPKISGGTDTAQFSGPNTTDSQSNLPPYVAMVFCQKQ